MSEPSQLGVGTGGIDQSNDVLGVVEFITYNKNAQGKNIRLLSYCMGANATFIAQGRDPELFLNSNVKA